MKKRQLKVINPLPNIDLLSVNLIVQGLQNRMWKKYLGFYFNETFSAFKKDYVDWHVDRRLWSKLGKAFFSLVNRDKQFPAIIYRNHKEIGRSVSKKCDLALAKEASQMSTNQIVKHLKDLFSGFSEICIWGIPIVTIDFKNNYLSDCLEEEISKAVNKHKINKIPQVVLSTLTTPLKNTYNKKELIDILKLAEKKDLDDKDIKKHSDKYCWIDYGYQGPAKSLNYYKKRLAEIKKNKKSPLQQLKDIARNDRELQEQQKRLSQQLHLDKQNKYLCKVAREFMFLKSYRQAILSKVAYTYDLLFKELTKQYKVTTKQLHHCLQEEIFGLLMGNSLNMTEINQRINSYYVYSYINGKNRLYYGNKAKKIIQDNLYKEEVDRNTKIITGTTAYWGKVQGTVRVVNVAKEMNKVKKGDILVSLATNPTIISAMKKAAAFVTDAGGITCHAAIVAREMKKPCVIGTKFATKVLKDGDKIEVDADKGIVKKL